MIGDTKPHNLGAQFEAKYDGKCPVCTLAVYAGDLMGWVDDEAVCDGCYNDAETENWKEIRANIRTQQEEDRAKDPEAYDARQLAATSWMKSVQARAAQEPGKEWVTAPGTTPGWVRNPEHEPPTEQEAPVGVEPGIQALMAAGLLQGQEPGGSGVCEATITDTSGKVTEVAIPVPVAPEAVPNDPAPAKAPRKRASRAKAKPEPVAPAEPVPSTGSVEDGAAGALARVKLAAMTEGDRDRGAARIAQLASNAEGWDPQSIANDVYGPGPQVDIAALQAAAQPPVADPLQVSLQAAVDGGAMTPKQAAALGWVAPVAQDEVAVLEQMQESGKVAMAALQAGLQPDAPIYSPATGPRTSDALTNFKANYSSPAADIFIDALAAATSMPEEDAILAALDSLAPYEGMPGGVEEAKKSILAVIEDAITNHPRSLQKSIGPSEIGTECDHCLAAKLAGWDQIREGGAWLPTVGTAVHTWVEEKAFRRVMLDAFGRPRYLMERKVAVGTIGGVEVTGSTDLVDLVRGMTWDWKVVGATTLKSAKAAPSVRYVVQQMLYARGWRRLGVNITHVGIAYLPRNDVSLRKAVLWTAPYDESVALEALDRANRIHANLQVMESISVEARDKYVTGLDRWRSWRENVGGIEKLVYGNAQEGQIECLDCARYADYPDDPAQALKQLEGIM